MKKMLPGLLLTSKTNCTRWDTATGTGVLLYSHHAVHISWIAWTGGPSAYRWCLRCSLQAELQRSASAPMFLSCLIETNCIWALKPAIVTPFVPVILTGVTFLCKGTLQIHISENVFVLSTWNAISGEGKFSHGLWLLLFGRLVWFLMLVAWHLSVTTSILCCLDMILVLDGVVGDKF